MIIMKIIKNMIIMIKKEYYKKYDNNEDYKK